MFVKIQKRLDRELAHFIKKIDKTYSLHHISPLLFTSVKDFLTREGKRLRPIIFVIGYLGFSKRGASHLYTSALSLELLHDFLLIHDDIIDKADTRRGKPSMHKMFTTHLKKFKKIKFTGEDLSIVAGDIIYAMALQAFLSINEDPQRKEKALLRFIQAALSTGVGEFIELLSGTKNLNVITKKDIEKIYDYKTACYTFACPLSTGALLAGAAPGEVNLLHRYGMRMGRAFQINDDILGMFSAATKTGKSTLSDLQEAKKTLLIWYAYNHAPKKDKITMEKLFTKPCVTKKDLCTMREILTASGALDFAKKEIAKLIVSGNVFLESSTIKPSCKRALQNFTNTLFKSQGHQVIPLRAQASHQSPVR